MSEPETLNEARDHLLAEFEKMGKGERAKRIEDLLHFLRFEQRWEAMTPAEFEHMDQVSLSPKARERLENAKTEAEREGLITMYARSHYFRQCAWLEYLNGETNEKPFDSTREKAA